MERKTITLEKQVIPVARECDVVVLGGGPAGIGAAIASARNGAKTVLVERYGFMGGMATAGLLPVITGTNSKTERIVKGVCQDLIDRMVAIGGAIDRQELPYPDSSQVTYEPNPFKYVADQMMKEAGVDVFLHTFFCDCIVENHEITGVIIESKSGRQAILAKYVIDATGDGDVAARAGAPFVKGRESDGLLMGVTMCFNLRNVNIGVDVGRKRLKEFPEYNEMLYNCIEKARKNGDFPWTPEYREGKDGKPYVVGPWLENLIKPDEISVNFTTLFGDPTVVEDLTRMEMEGREYVQKFIQFFRKYVPGFENCCLTEVAPQLGIRESRRICGEYTLTAEDVHEGSRFDDAIAVGGSWSIDIHRSFYGDEHIFETVQNTFDIPYRCLLAKNVKNLLTAGRCISVSRVGLGIIRLMAPCFAIGEGAGVAAALATKEGKELRELDVKKIQQTLRDEGAFLR